MKEKGALTKMVRDGEAMNGVFYLRTALCSTTRSGKPYWKMQISDCSGCLTVYLWDQPTVVPQQGSVIWLSGQGRCLGSKLICDVISMLELSDWCGCPLLLASPDTPFPEEVEKVSALLSTIEDEELKIICRKIVSNRQLLDSFLRAPGSLRHHHAYPGGLIRHTRETMEIVLNQAKELAPIEKDLLVAAAFLHDLGKAFEYNRYRMSDRGTFLGHEVTLLELLAPIMNEIWELNDPTRIALLHFLVAKPAPQWTGIRHPRSALINILRFADKLSGELDMQSKTNAFTPLRKIGLHMDTRKVHFSTHSARQSN